MICTYILLPRDQLASELVEAGRERLALENELTTMAADVVKLGAVAARSEQVAALLYIM
jgi:hypothetical protein